MKHFVLTRFNMRIGSWKYDKNGEPVLDEPWMIQRFDLFEKYCVPSVVAQTNKNFKWIICFDIHTSEEWRSRIEACVSGLDNVILLYLDGMERLFQGVSESIRQHIGNSDDFVITTRLDNDDIIHKDFIGTIQSLARPEEQLIIDLRQGYRLSQMGSEFLIRKDYRTFNPFISIVEKVNEFHTIFHKRHREWKNSKNVVCYSGSPMWIQYVHERNFITMNNDSLFYVSDPDLSGFQLDITLNSYSTTQLFFQNTLAILNRVKNIF